MTCVHCRVEDRLSVCIKVKTPSYIPKKKLQLCICVWTPMTWPRISEFTFPSKIPSRNSWKIVQLSKMLCNNIPLITQRFNHHVLLLEFPGVVPSLNLSKVPSVFREYLIFFLLFLNHGVFDKFIQFKSCVKSASQYLYCSNGITNSWLKSVTEAMCQMIMWLNLVYEPFSKKCDIYCNKRYGCINYAAPHKGLQ